MHEESPRSFDIKDYELFLSDESRLSGSASAISFPSTFDEIVSTCKTCSSRLIPITLQGSRTGISGGAVPCGGHVMSFAGFTKVRSMRFDPAANAYLLSVEPGLTLAGLREAVSQKAFDTSGWSSESVEALGRFESDGEFFFPPDPTETTASIGGMVSCNASGARSFMYGPTRNFVGAIRIVLADGRSAWLRRKEHVTQKRDFSFTLDDGSVLAGKVPSYDMVSVKNAAGYFAKDDMDLVDLFIGAEGTLAIVCEIELAIIRKPKAICGVTVFFGSEEDAIGFVSSVRGNTGRCICCMPAAIEYFDGNALRFLDRVKHGNDAFSFIPQIPGSAQAAVYVELHASAVTETDRALYELASIIEKCGGDEDATWIANTDKDLATLTGFRHALPEAVNMYVASLKKEIPEITKLGTDMSVPDSRLAEIYDVYRKSLAKEKLESVIFGHIGNNHLHVNILPRTREEYETGKAMYLGWAEKVVAMGGSVSAEHGIGKLKVSLLEKMYGREGIDQMRRCKQIFDPANLLGRGNLFAL